MVIFVKVTVQQPEKEQSNYGICFHDDFADQNL